MTSVLTYDEFIAFGGNKDKVTDIEFNSLLITAEQAINVLTSGFYDDPEVLAADYESQRFKFRAKRYKQALAQQVRYYADLGAQTAAQISSRPLSQSIGDTSITYGRAPGAAGNGGDDGTSVTVAPEAYGLLEDTGLLYRGAILCRRRC